MSALLGREMELAALSGLLDRAAGRQGGALVLHGPAGVGKTALAAAAATQASGRGLRVLSTTAYQAEIDVPFAGLHGLLRSILDGDSTSAAKTTVLQAVRGTGEVVPHRLGLGVLELLTEDPRPLLVVVEDAHWLDQPSWEALGFVSRRIESDPVAVLIAMREGADAGQRLSAARLPVQEVVPLAETSARQLLQRVAPDLSAALRERVLADAAGNPLGIVEFGSAAARSGDEALPPSWLPLTTRVEQTFMALVSAIPAPTRTLLHVAAHDDSDDLAEILAATALLEAGAGVEPASAAGLVAVEDGRLRFRHPLLRSALRQATTTGQRVEIHAALARATSAEADREIWHRAAAALGPDEALARDLSAAAIRAVSRTAMPTAVAAMERAAVLSEDPAERASRLVTALNWVTATGDHPNAMRLAGLIEEQHLREYERVRLAWFREGYLGGGWTGASRMAALASAVNDMHDQGQTDLAFDMLQSTTVRLYWSNPDAQTCQIMLGTAERLGIDPHYPRMIAMTAGVAPIERGRDVLDRLARVSTRDDLHSWDLNSLATAASLVGAFDLSMELFARSLEGMRESMAMGLLAQVLMGQVWVAARLGDTWLGLIAATECETLAIEAGFPRWALTSEITRGQLLALRGRVDEARALADRGEAVLLPLGAHPMLAMVQLARGTAALAEGRHSSAFDELHRIFDPEDLPFHPHVRLHALGLLAEAAVHSGQHERLAAIVEEFEPIAALHGSPSLDRTLAYARAVLAPDDKAEQLFEDALSAELEGWRFERARLELEYGAWLRRRRRPAESRARLRAAAAGFDALGVTPWADRARAELAASGETLRRPDDGRDRLTPQELQIAQLAANGLSNRDIAERLFISPRTVSTHLYRVYPKLGIASRTDLPKVLTR